MVRSIARWTVVLVAMSSATFAAEGPARFESPQAVFDAYRKALTQRDWPRVLECLAPAMREEAIFEAYLKSQFDSHRPEVAAVVARYCGDIEAAYLARTKQPPGAVSAKVEATNSKPPTVENGNRPAVVAQPGRIVPQSPAVDPALLRGEVLRGISDSAQFFGAIMELTTEKNAASRIGPLRRLAVTAERATGTGSFTVGSQFTPPGGAPQTRRQIVARSYHFRRAEGGWLIERIE